MESKVSVYNAARMISRKSTSLTTELASMASFRRRFNSLISGIELMSARELWLALEHDHASSSLSSSSALGTLRAYRFEDDRMDIRTYFKM